MQTVLLHRFVFYVCNRILLETSARVVLDSRDGSLAQQVRQLNVSINNLPLFRPTGTVTVWAHKFDPIDFQ